MGAVRGTVTDPGGALIRGAKVTLENEGTGLAITKLTAKDGTYTFSPVQIGSYQITVEYPGFRPATSHFVVTVQEQARADFRMIPGGATDTVTVTGLAPQLQTQDASVGSVISSRQITSLPLNTLNYTFLAQLDAGVTSLSPTRGLNNTGSFVANGLPSIHNNYLLDGIDNNNDTVDYLNGTAYVNLPPPDAIQEFKLQTSNFSAEFGRAGGAVINASLKSGTNEFHGSAWEFLRNDMLDASSLGNYFTAPANRVKGELRRNQFGVSAGGPILKNRTFFFGDYAGTRIVSDGTSRPTVPTNAEVSSGYTDFRDLFSYTSATSKDALGRTFNQETALDPATTRPVTKGKIDPVTNLAATSTGYVRDPFVAPGAPGIAGTTNFATAAWFQHLNQIPQSRLDPVAIKLLQLYPAANAPGFVNNYQITQKTPDNANHFDARVDQVLGQRDQMFGRVSYTNRHEFVPATFPASSHTFSSGNGDFDDRSLNLAYSNTYTFTPHLVNETRFGYSHLYTSSQPPDANTMGIPAQYGIAGIPQVAGNGGLPAIGISGLTSLGIQTWASPNWRVSNTYQVTSNLIWNRGGHNLKTGIEYQHLRFPWVDPTTSHGSFSFGGYTGIPGITNGIGMADLLLTPVASTVQGGVDDVGGANGVAASAIAVPNDYRNIFGVYIQDDWKATRKLTLNLGLRWEYFGSLQEQEGRQAALESDENGANAKYVILDRQKNLPVSTAFLALLAKDGIPLDYVSQIHSTPLTNFAPRVGLAYLITPKLVARSSYGIFYSGFENLGGSPDPGADYPFSSNFSFARPDPSHPLTFLNGSVATIENGLSAVNLEPSSPQFTPENLSPTAFVSKWTTAYVQEWNAALEYQLTPTQTVTLTYVGSNTHHMWNSALTNEPNVILPPNTPNTTALDPYPDLARNMIYQVPNGSAIYESMQIKFERRFSNGLNLLANYTQEVCKTDNHSPLNIPDEADRMQAYNLPGWGIHKGYQYCGSDAPRIFHASGIWELPIGRGRFIAGGASGVVNGIIGGWSAQGIFAAQDGFPFSVGCATSTTAIYGCYADVVPNQSIYSHKGPHGITQFLNPAAFTNPPVATSIGQSDYSPLGGPATQAHGPGYNDLDLSVFKRFAVRENTHLEFRGEFYNALNHPNFSNSFSTLNFTNPQFGKISGTRGNERQVQLAMKYYW